MARSAVTENDGFDQGGPVQVVYVVQRCAGGDQLFDHAVVPKVGSCDKRGAVVSAGDQFGAAAD